MAGPSSEPGRTWRLMGEDGQTHDGPGPGTLGGHRRQRIYGRLDCPAARRALARGGYRTHRVFFADEPTAVAAGYRPCAVCLPDAHRDWRARRAPERPADGKAGPVRGIQRRGLLGAGQVPAPDRSDAVSATDIDARSLLWEWTRLSTEVALRVSPIMLLVRSAAATDADLAVPLEDMAAQRPARMTLNHA